MRRFWLSLATLCLAAAPAWSQIKIHNPPINTEEPPGQLIQKAGQTEDPAAKIDLLEGFVERFPDDPAIGYVYFLLQDLYLQQKDYQKAVAYSDRLMEINAKDLEVRHGTIRALQGAQQWDRLFEVLQGTYPLAERVINSEPPGEDAYRDEKQAWKSNVDYAKGVRDYVEYSLYTSTLQIQDPNTRIKFLQMIEKHYPAGRYSARLWDQYLRTYQQLGDQEGIVRAARMGLEKAPNNPDFLRILGETALGQQQYKQAQEYGDRLVKLAGTAEKPEGVSDEEWTRRTELWKALGNSIKGRVLVFQNTPDSYRAGRRLMLQAVEPIRELGGSTYGTLAYFLGFCYVKLDIQCDNIRHVRRWLGIASKLPPYQQQAKDLLAKANQGCPF